MSPFLLDNMFESYIIYIGCFVFPTGRMEDFMKLKIEARDKSDERGGFFCHFTHGKKKFYASISKPSGTYTECMIFKEGKWNELYCNRYIPLSKNALIECIKEFIKSLDE